MTFNETSENMLPFTVEAPYISEGLKRNLNLEMFFMEDSEMKKINVEDRTQIKQLLYTGNVFAVKDDQYKSFGGFQLWWYDKSLDLCNYCGSYWSDLRRKIQHCSLNKAAKILWRRRHSLFLRSKRLHEDKNLIAVGQ